MLHGHFACAQTPPVPQQPEKPNIDTNSTTVGELHTHNILLLYLNMEVNWEALQLCAVYKQLYLLLQVTSEFVPGTTSYMRCV